jgi:murein DD-endopeptidase MepM/ murein hydrolase activator NlpD
VKAIILILLPPVTLLSWGWFTNSWRTKTLILVALLTWSVSILSVLISVLSVLVSVPKTVHPLYKTPVQLTQWYHDGSTLAKDFSGGCGSTLYAPISGTVLGNGYDGYTGPHGYNNSYMVLSDGTTRVKLLHGEYTPSVHQTILAGTPIGTESSTGNSTGCHTHIEVTVDGVPVDPEGWVR